MPSLLKFCMCTRMYNQPLNRDIDTVPHPKDSLEAPPTQYPQLLSTLDTLSQTLYHDSLLHYNKISKLINL